MMKLIENFIFNSLKLTASFSLRSEKRNNRVEGYHHREKAPQRASF